MEDKLLTFGQKKYMFVRRVILNKEKTHGSQTVCIFKVVELRQSEKRGCLLVPEKGYSETHTRHH